MVARYSILRAYSLRISLRSRHSTVLASTRRLAMRTNCGASAASNFAAFRLRDRRSSVLIRGISSFRLRAMLLSFTSWLAWMRCTCCATNFSSGRLTSPHNSEQNFVNCAFRRERSLLSCTGGRLRNRQDFFAKTLLSPISSPTTSPNDVSLCAAYDYPFQQSNSDTTVRLELKQNQLVGVSCL